MQYVANTELASEGAFRRKLEHNWECPVEIAGPASHCQKRSTLFPTSVSRRGASLARVVYSRCADRKLAWFHLFRRGIVQPHG